MIFILAEATTDVGSFTEETRRWGNKIYTAHCLTLNAENLGELAQAEHSLTNEGRATYTKASDLLYKQAQEIIEKIGQIGMSLEKYRTSKTA